MRLFLLLLLIFAFLIPADISSDTISFGQKNLFAMIEASGGFNGKILLTDARGTSHERCMLSVLTRLVPNQNIITLGEAMPETPSILDKRAVYRERKMREHSVRVAHVPRNYIVSAATIIKESDLQVLRKNDVLAVYGTGNVGSYPHMDIFHPEDPYWGHLEEGDFLRARSSAVTFEEVKTYFQAGHAVVVSYAMKKPATFEEFVRSIFTQEYIEDIGGREALKEMYQNANRYIRHPYLVRFGDLKEYGFTILLTDNDVTYVTCDGSGRSIPSSSFASAHLSVFAFYLFQLWDTTAEVVEVMQKTATDIGEPGPDEEFGWGLINADHPIIWNRAIERLQQSLSFCLLEDVAFEEAITTASKNEGLDIFYDIRSDKREVGLTYNKGKTTLAFTTGSAHQGVFGLRSRFLHRQNPFVQIGLQHSLINSVSFVGVFGQSEQEDFSIRKGSLGMHYQSNISEKGDLSLYAGYRTIWGTFGLPGYKTVGVSQIPFALHTPEVRASFSWFF